jgi:DNA-binding GntR family transcriptional regulator
VRKRKHTRYLVGLPKKQRWAIVMAMDTTPDPTPDTGAARGKTAARSRREAAYLEIRRMALEGEFPFWQRLPEEGISEQLGVSRTPVREAFARLDADGILSRYDDGGYYVAEPNLIDLRDLYELRLTLELRGILRAAEDGVEHDAELLEGLRAEWLLIQASPPPADGSFIELDESFHVGLSRASGNLIITETLESVNIRIRPVRMHDFLDAERIEISIREHIEILDAVIAREIESAADLLRRHIGVSLDVVEERAAGAMTKMMRLRSRRR